MLALTLRSASPPPTDNTNIASLPLAWLVPSQAAKTGSQPSSLVRAMAVWALARLLDVGRFDSLRTRHLPREIDPAVAVEWSDASRAGFYPLYAVWNNGLRITATGGEDSISNLHRSKLVGSVRTYVHTGTRGLDMDAWFEGLRAGRAFVSSGPLVDLTIDGKMPGEEVTLPSDGGTVEIVGRVRSVTPLDRLFLVCDGETVTNVPLGGDGRTARLRMRHRITRSGWCHLRAEGATGDRFPMDVAYVQGFTNPVWLQVGDQPVRSRDAADYALRWIDTLQEMADAWPGWRAEKERAHVFAQFDEARAVYRRFARESVD